MSIGPIERVSLSTVAVDQMRQAIYEGTFQPGQRLVVDQLAKMLHTSNGPVRDAINQLEHEGLVVRERNQGAVVVDLSLHDIQEIGSLRLAVELTGLPWTIERASEEDFAAFEQVLARLSLQVETHGPLIEMVKLDLEFHEQLLRLSGHRRLLSTWEALRSQLWFLIYSYKTFRGSGYQAPSHADHFELMKRLRRRDLEGAQRCLREHLEASTADFVTAYHARLRGERRG